MEKNKTGKYLKYAVGEIILVVIGILIALQLNVYKENHQTNSIRIEYYSQIIDDLNNDKNHLKENLAEIILLKEQYDEYIETFKEQDLTSNKMLENLMNLNYGINLISFNSSTFESLEKTGDIKILPKLIREKLLKLNLKQILLTEKVRNNGFAQGDFLKEYLLAIGSQDLSNRILAHPKIEQFLSKEINKAKAILAIEATMRWKLMTEKSGDFKEIIIEIESLIKLIETELKK